MNRTTPSFFSSKLRWVDILLLLLLATTATRPAEAQNIYAVIEVDPHRPSYLLYQGETVTFNALAGSQCSSIEFVDWYIDGNYVTLSWTLVRDDLALGTHTIKVVVNDHCGYTASDEITVEVVAAPTRYYYVTDHLGSVRATVDENGEVVSRADYYPFGLEMEERTVVGDVAVKENYTGHEKDDETGLLYAGARYHDPEIGRWMVVDPWADKYPSLSSYNYVANNPLSNYDPNGKGIVPKILKIGAKIARNGFNKASVVESFAGNIQDAQTVFDSEAGTLDRVVAGASLLSEIAPVSVDDVKWVGGAVAGALGFAARRGDDAADASKVAHAANFDEARRKAFENAGMTDPGKVSFSKVDPETGTVVEFKGPGGAKVAYDSPHADMDASKGHDKPHVGWQTAGKRKSGEGQRGNITYDGPQHPHRSNEKKDQ